MIQEQRGTFAFFGDFLDWLGPARRLQDSIEQANLKYRATDVLAISVLIAGAVYLLLGLFGHGIFLLRLLIAAAFGCLPIFYIMRVRARRLAKFEESLPGRHRPVQPLHEGRPQHPGRPGNARRRDAWIRSRWSSRSVIEELALGSQLEAALHNLGRRVPLIDLKFFITGLILQRQTGANMVAVLENLSCWSASASTWPPR